MHNIKYCLAMSISTLICLIGGMIIMMFGLIAFIPVNEDLNTINEIWAKDISAYMEAARKERNE